MRRGKQGLGILLVLALSLIVVVWTSGGEPRSGDGAVPAETADMGPELAAPLPEAAAAIAPQEQPTDRSPVTTPLSPEPSGPTCRVFGILEDEHGAPLAGVQASLQSVGEVWAEGLGRASFKALSDADGRFEFVTPLPTSSWISLRLEPGRFHAIQGRHFGKAGGRNRDPLVEGDNDLGRIMLSTTGAIGGYLRCADGAAPEHARVRLDGSFPGGYSLSAAVETSGRFVIEHVPPGNYNIEALSKGYLTAKLSSVVVRALEVSEGHELTIERAPFVAGRVLDETGAPVEGVKLWGWPQGSGQGAGARTDAEGFFTVYLPQEEPYLFTAKKPDYATFGEEGGRRGVTYAPGTTGIAIELVREFRTTFVVVDADTGHAVERFGLSIGPKSRGGWSSSVDRSDVPLGDYPGGERSAPADPAKHAFRIQAPGYAPMRGDVQHESADSPRQEIRLEPEGLLRGRVLFDGQPLPGASVRVERCRFPKPGETREAVPDIFDDTMTYDLDRYTGRIRILSCDEFGVFELGELATGTYRVDVSAKVGSPLVREDIAVTSRETTEMGDLPLVLGAVVRGQLVLDGGVTSAGLEVHLDSTWDGDSAFVGADGVFELRGVAPGDHTLEVSMTSGVISTMEPFGFHAKSGDTLDLTLDLREWQTGSVRVRILEGGMPRANLRAELLFSGGATSGREALSNAAGELVIECPRKGVIAIAALSERGMYLGRTTGPVVVTPGAEELALIEFESGELTVIFPPDFEVSPGVGAQLALESEVLPSGSRLPVMLTTDPTYPVPPYSFWEGREVPLGRVASGDYEIAVGAWRKASAGSPALQTKFSASVKVLPGKQAVATLKHVP